MTEILLTRELLQVEGVFAGNKVKAEIQTDAGVIKKIGNGVVVKNDIPVALFILEENGYMNITLHQNGIGNYAEVCNILPLFISDVQKKIQID